MCPLSPRLSFKSLVWHRPGPEASREVDQAQEAGTKMDQEQGVDRGSAPCIKVSRSHPHMPPTPQEQ